MSGALRTLLVFIASLALGCLERAEEMIDPVRVFGEAGDPESALHVEDDPELAANVERFVRGVAYVRAFADGEPVRYWLVEGTAPDLIAPAFFVEGPGGPVGPPIIDVLPGDTGYTPWWRKIIVRTTSRYGGERIASREALDLGVRLGLLEEPEPTAEILDCPIVFRDAEIPVSDTAKAPLEWVWYRGRRVHWIPFSDALDVVIEERRVPAFPVYVFQRIHEPIPLNEGLAGFDLNGDGDLDDTNNVFASGLDGPRYSPAWLPVLVRTTRDYLSIDSEPPAQVGLTAEDQFVNTEGAIISSNVLSLQPVPATLLNCPIQRTEGSL